MYPSIEKTKAILLRENYISEADSAAAEAVAQDGAGYINYLMSQELLSKPLLGQALAEAYGIPFADLASNPPTKEAVNSLDETIARANRLLFLKSNDRAVLLATDNPTGLDAKALRGVFADKTIRLTYTLPEYIDDGLRLYAKSLETRFSKIIKEGKRVAPEIVDEIFRDAVQFQASDIHFEPTVTEIIVRFRVDGLLRDAGLIPREYYDNILNRIKVESGMRIDEHSSAQDGSLQHIDGDLRTDVRVSLVPTVQGEKVVMRLLNSYVQGVALADIGFDADQLQRIEAYCHKPFGMILTVGPTGSGKTTTLYAMLKTLNEPGVNITTIEDPVEYKVDRINQIQVRERSNLTFAKGLRAIVRQDPDIILVGEIRDQETAEISVNAALTGHLLFSTFHANNAATAIPRLIDMGVEPFLLSSTLELVLAQRLVRQICPHCKHSLPVAEALADYKTLQKLFDKDANLYAGKGCLACNGSGYKGRVALFEFIEVTPEMSDLILTSPSTSEITSLARKQGGASMFDDGIKKIKSGLTTIEEVLRVVEPPKKA